MVTGLLTRNEIILARKCLQIFRLYVRHSQTAIWWQCCIYAPKAWPLTHLLNCGLHQHDHLLKIGSRHFYLVSFKWLNDFLNVYNAMNISLLSVVKVSNEPTDNHVFLCTDKRKKQIDILSHRPVSDRHILSTIRK